MKTTKSMARRITASAAIIGIGVGVTVTTTAASSVPGADVQAAVISPLVSQSVANYEGKWAVQGGTLVESFQENGEVVSTGSTSLRTGLPADQIISFGYVAGFGSAATGQNYAQLSGQAGEDVTAVRVISASGTVTETTLADGIWGAVWLAGSNPGEYSAATLEFDTPAGTRTVSTIDVDVIAADQ
ncbi:hypothetical protein, partial [Arthrobacter zhaoguopingii]|uniref:hypothetical protein n=1 Tax=Arthrobacter zhaoguopingii TaxID=2681491 RepID=UPI0013570221